MKQPTDTKPIHRTPYSRPEVKDDVAGRMGVAVPVSIALNLLVFVALANGNPDYPSKPEPTPTPSSGPVIMVPGKTKQQPTVKEEKVDPKPKKKTVTQTDVQITRRKPDIEEPEVTPEKPEHGPMIVEKQPTEVTNTPDETVQPSPEPKPTTGDTAPAEKSEPAEMTPKQYGGAAFTGAPADVLKETSTRPEQMAAPKIRESATAAGGTLETMATAAEIPAPAVNAAIDKTVKDSPVRNLTTYVPVATVRASAASGFTVPSVAVTSAATPARGAMMTAARTAEAFTVPAAQHPAGGGNALESPARTYSLRPMDTGRRPISGPTLPGPGKNPGNSIRESAGGFTAIANQSGTGDAVRGTAVGGGLRETGAVAASGTTPGSLQGTGEVADTTNGNGTGRLTTMPGTTGIRGTVVGGNNANQTGTGGELLLRPGSGDGTVSVGKIGGANAAQHRNGEFGDGPGPILNGPGGNGPGDTPAGGSRFQDTRVDERDDEQFADTESANLVPAKATVKPAFNMPSALVERKVSGLVKVRVTIKADGAATVVLSESSGNVDLDAAVVAHIKTYRWEPARKNGTPVDSVKILKFRVN